MHVYLIINYYLFRYHARDLYEPDEELRSLGLPVVEWDKDKWSSTSSEGMFVNRLELLIR